MIHSAMMDSMSSTEFLTWAAFHRMRQQAEGGQIKPQATQQSPEAMVAQLRALSKGVPPKAHRAKR